MLYSKVRAGLLGAGFLLAACDDPARPELRDTLEILTDSAELMVGDTIQLSARLVDPAGQVMPAAISWSSMDSVIATVNPDGRLIALQAGSAQIIARAASASDTVLVRISQIGGCDQAGVTHSGSITSPARWTALNSPHFVHDIITVRADLTIEAGAIVCGGPAAQFVLRGGNLTADGRANRRIRFIALDTVAGWRGIAASASSEGPGGRITLNYADVYYAAGVSAGFESTGEINHSYFRRTFVGNGGANISFFAIRNSIVEDGNVALSGATFEETVVRRGSLSFLPAQPGTGSGTLNGGRIEDSPGVALTIGSTFSSRSPAMTVLKAPQIVGSTGGIAVMPAQTFFQIWPTPAEQTPLTNNLNRTIRLWGTSYGDLHFRAGLDWSINSVITFFDATSLRLDPGATLTIGSPLRVSGALTAPGTADEPISITSVQNCLGSSEGCALIIADTAASVLSYVNFRSAPFVAGASNVVRLDHITSDRTIALGSPGSRITDAHISGVPAPQFPSTTAALTLGANDVTAERVLVRLIRGRSGVRIAGSNVKLLSCEVTDNIDDGVVVSAGSGIEMRNCVFERNSGVGVNNQTENIVNAQRNWWGDPEGPLGAGGDGVAGVVDYSNPLTTRTPTLAAGATRIEITSAKSSVPTSDTLRYSAIAYDSAGRPITEPLLWSVSDTQIAFVVPNEDGLVVGSHVGNTTVTVRSANRPNVSASVALAVTAGAPMYRWTKEPLAITGRVLQMAGSDLNHIFASVNSDTVGGGINTAKTCCLVRREGTVWNQIADANVTWTGRLSVAPTGEVFVESQDSIGYFDGVSFRRLAPKPSASLYQFAATSANELYMAGDQGRLWRYRNGTVELVRAEAALANTQVFARSANEVYFQGINFSSTTAVANIFKWNGTSWMRLPDPPRYSSITADERYVYTGGYRYDGTQWQLMPGFSANETYTVYPVSSTFMVVTRNATIYLYDGSTLRTLWSGERLKGAPSLLVFPNEIFIANGTTIMHGVPE